MSSRIKTIIRMVPSTRASLLLFRRRNEQLRSELQALSYRGLQLRQPFGFGLVEIEIFENQMDAVRRAGILHRVDAHIVDLDGFAFGHAVSNAVDVEGDLLVGD